MRRKRRETVRMKEKKRLNRDIISVVISLACVAIAGVFLWTNGKRPEMDNGASGEVAAKEDVSVPAETSREEDKPVVVQISLTEELNPSEEPAVNTSGFLITSGEVKEVQPIQEEPKAPVEVMDPPTLKEGTDLTDPGKVPEYVQQTETSEKPQDTVKTKKTKDESHPGQIYVEGFGWIQDIGPGVVVDLTDMYMNGNIIGDM
jgi:hypothetical protein